jgi:membrane-associated phospholipid phosphatase
MSLSTRSVRQRARAVVFIACLSAASAARGQTTVEAGSAAPNVGGLVKAVARDLVSLVSMETLWVLGGGGGLALAVHPADAHVNDQLGGSDYRFLSSGRVIGHSAVQAGGALTTYFVGRALAPDGRAARIGAQLVRAQAVTQAVTLGIKVAVRRDRPDENGHLSFPSGHASTTFATATVIAHHVGWQVAVPTYLVATYVATSRLHEHRHFVSDVVFGAAVGTAAGLNAVKSQGGGSGVTWIPVVTPTHAAVMISYAP